MSNRSPAADRAATRLAIAMFALVLLCLGVAGALAVLNAMAPVGARVPVGGEITLMLAMGAFPVAGLVIAVREPRNATGWILLAIGVIWAGIAVADGYVRYALFTAPGACPAPTSPRWRPFAWAVAGMLTSLTPAACNGCSCAGSSPRRPRPRGSSARPWC